MLIDPQRTATLIVHFQNDFCAPDSDPPIPNRDELASNINELFSLCQVTNIPVFLSKAAYDEKYLWDHQKLPNFRERDYPCREGTKGHEYYKIKPPENAFEFRSSRNDSLAQTPLESILKNQQRDTLILAGITTEVCIHATATSADSRGFNVIVLSDVVGSSNPKKHEFSLKVLNDHFAHVLSLDQLKQLLL